MTTQTEALKRYLDDCDKHAIVRDIAGAFHFAWQEALAQPEQEPAATAYFEKITGRIVPPDDTHRRKFPMCYRPLVFGDAPPHPPQRTEQNFCPRCGKRNKDMHTCTPPQEGT